jgi:hypothetical protein
MATEDIKVGTTGQVIDPEHVAHPLHYNNHASGVEAIEIARDMTFNLGSAFKYMVRLYDKGTPLKDAKKALWYVKDELGNCPVEAITYIPDDTVRHHLVVKVLRAEPKAEIAEALKQIHLFQRTGYDYFGKRAASAVEGVIQMLINDGVFL